MYPPISGKFADPDIFSPERWENWQPKPWQYLPFNGGPRICVGQNFALTEMAYVSEYLIYAFYHHFLSSVYLTQNYYFQIANASSNPTTTEI